MAELAIPLWVWITLAAAALQNLRSLLQKRLTGRLSVGGATFSRFLFAAPLALVYVLALREWGAPIPDIPGKFWPIIFVGAVGQIIGTFTLVGLFKLRNFAVGNAFSKTETLQAAFFGLILLGEALTPFAVAAILIGFGGIAALSIPKGATFDKKAALIGMGSGAGFGVAAICYRAGALSLDGTDTTMQAAMSLLAALCIQTLVMGVWLALVEKGQITRVIRAARATMLVSLVGVLSSIGWFTAMAMENAALVRAVGQVELVFSILTAWLIFKERSTGREIAGVILVALSVILIVLSH